jgi:hypothetical protein
MEDGVDRSTEWTCCDQPLPATQTRCGKCNKWRGGKRRPAKPTAEGEAKKLKTEEDNMIEPTAVDIPLLPDGEMQEADSEVVVNVAEEELTTTV